jgi:hypothetical protein
LITENADQDQFITDHRWGVLTTLRQDGQPVSSVVAYARDGDTLVVSTPGTTFKARSAGRDGRATLCVITNQEPFNFVSVEGRVDRAGRSGGLACGRAAGDSADTPPTRVRGYSLTGVIRRSPRGWTLL